jgi:hypothetical protein
MCTTSDPCTAHVRESQLIRSRVRRLVAQSCAGRCRLGFLPRVLIPQALVPWYMEQKRLWLHRLIARQIRDRRVVEHLTALLLDRSLGS